jgi:predicted metal-dependent phosphoesterase TrpH
VELHSHTEYSHDGHMRFGEMVRVARRRGLDAIAITDHDTVEGALEFRRLNARSPSGLHIIVGEERTLADGSHVIGLFLREQIRSDDFDSVVKEIWEQGGICVFPHPFRRKDGAFRLPRPSIKGGPLCFEIFNPKCSYEENHASRQLSATGWPAVGGSDAHYESDLAESVNEIPFQGDIEQSIRLALDGQGPFRVLGIHQVPGTQGRKYARLHYRVGTGGSSGLPAAAAFRMYRAFRNGFRGRSNPALEVKCSCEKGRR